MKLEDYLVKRGTTKLADMDRLYPLAGRYVIGTCGECKHWDLFSSVTTPRMGECNHKARLRRKASYFWAENDGCIHWAQKERS